LLRGLRSCKIIRQESEKKRGGQKNTKVVVNASLHLLPSSRPIRIRYNNDCEVKTDTKQKLKGMNERICEVDALPAIRATEHPRDLYM
jgi:hypothetical protein